MYDHTGEIVRAVNGRDKGNILCVVGMNQERPSLSLADGKRRKIAKPKRKTLGDVEILADHQHIYDHPVIHSLRRGEPVSDRALRRALAAFKEGYSLG